MNRPDSAPPSKPQQPFLVALAAWALPGLGYQLVGERARGLTVGLTVIALFVGGLLIGGVRALEVPFDKGGFSLGRIRSEIAEKPWYVAQVLIGPVGMAAAKFSTWAGEEDPATREPRGVLSHARANEIGVLYMAVAGMLNLLAIIDSAHRAGRLLERK